jgi:hypothetical protein
MAPNPHINLLNIYKQIANKMGLKKIQATKHNPSTRKDKSQLQVQHPNRTDSDRGNMRQTCDLDCAEMDQGSSVMTLLLHNTRGFSNLWSINSILLRW